LNVGQKITSDMRAVISCLAIVIVVLAAWLIREVKRRQSAEDRLEALSRGAATVSTRKSDGAERDSATLESLVRENRHLREQIISSQSGSAAKVAILRDVFVRLPEQSIPELQFATDGDWYSAVDGTLETVDDYRRALSKLRSSAQGRFAAKAQPALAAYLSAHDGKFPTEVSQLVPYFDGSIDEATLRRYKVVPAGEVSSVQVGGEWAITQRSVVDSVYDSHSVIGPRGHGAFNNTPSP
jgi:hypothetical protein